ncbi:hydroxymethylglutaryl-CoA lyase [Stella humosa]|uniref:Hydroxymethylglutaryl-CoA lyase n=1 Tax=Stella humosa TaxID=94 RepID=A0A3N1MGG5_9PROT|nr:hydroxymethylglutaryl-CoA lyase [Stella humosa]ROQ00286.1 hydroxymethylglutaryl-CoA lyase [Stella humosa]BBK30476.1 hydroxymethylglutaryl-CoA lyase [Stella humosa]
MSDLPKSVHILEVGPRDGLQIEPNFVPTADKIRMIEALADAGLPEIEAGSFVNPRAVPQMADGDEVFAGIRKKEGVAYRALWLNARGLERAIANGHVDVNGKLTMTCSETFIRRNTNRSIDDTLAEMPEWIARYKAAGVEVRTLGLMAAFGCNFEGYIPEAKVVELIARAEAVMADHDCKLKTLNLADTMGWASPMQVKRLVGLIRDRWPELRIKLHLHDTRGQAVANAVAAMEMGVTHFDASVGGLGGCPFAGHKGAAGNVSTEDLVFSCHEMGIETGIDLDALVEVARMAEGFVGHELPGKVMKGGTLNRYKTQH